MTKDATQLAAILKGWGPTLQRVIAKASKRWPAGAPGGKGGQFAPGSMGGGSGFKSGQLSLLGGLKAPQYGVGKPMAKNPMAAGPTKWVKPGSQLLEPSEPLQPKPAPAGAKPHLKTDDYGKPVTINYPTKPSAPDTWTNPQATATFVPGGAVPARLNGVAMKPWADAPKNINEWANVDGQKPELDAQFPIEPVPGKSVGSGVIVVESDGRVWLTKPTNGFGGYQQTFPKGTVENGLPLQASAIKEAYEETGLKVRITGVLGDYERTTSVARYYIAQRVGGTPADMGWESQAVRLVPQGDLKKFLNMGVDKDIVDDYRSEFFLKRAPLSLIRDHEAIDLEVARRGLEWLLKAGKPKGSFNASQPRWPAGTPLGGQWKAFDGDGVLMPPKVGSASNPAATKKAQSLYDLMKGGKKNTLLDAAIGLQNQVDDNAKLGKSNYHTKELAKVSQYANALVSDMLNAPKAEASAAKIMGPDRLSAYTYAASKPGGSNDGAVYSDSSGTKWLVKGNNYAATGGIPLSDDRAKNEVLASKLMGAAGIPGPEIKLVDLEGKHQGNLGVAVKWIDGLQAFKPADASQLSAVQQQYAVHAWLGNWDVLGQGLDNVMFKDGQAINIDPGGSLLFRAQGAPKAGAAFDAQASDWETMRTTDKHQKSVFGKMTASQLQDSAKQLANISDETIKKLVEAHGPGDANAKAELAGKLIARRNSILMKAGLQTEAMKLAGVEVQEPKPAPPPAPPKLAETVAAPAGTAAPMGLQKPVFASGLPSDTKYAAAASSAESLHKAGNLAALKSLATMNASKKLFQGKTINSKALAAYHGALVADLEAKQGKAVDAVAAGKAAVTDAKGQQWQAQGGVLNPSRSGAAPVTPKTTVDVQQPAAAAPKLPLPDFQSQKLPLTNQNAPSHNKKMDALETLSKAGDVKGILALNFGTNNYAAKQVKLANDALAALGSPHKVAKGQGKNAHPALVGGTFQNPAGAAASAPAAAQPKPAGKETPIYKIPRPPDFENWNGPGSGLSGVKAINLANNKTINELFALGEKLDLKAVESYQFEELDKTTGKPTGKMLPISQHKSKHIVAYHADVIAAIKTPYVPPKVLTTDELAAIPDQVKTIVKGVEDVKLLKDAKNALGRYAIVGQVAGKPFDGFPPQTLSQKQGNAPLKQFYDQSWAGFNGLSKVQQQAIKDYTGNSYTSMNASIVADNPNDKAGKAIEGLKKAAIPLPAGLVLSRKFTFPENHAENVKKLIASVGTVVKEFGIISTSTDPQVWGGKIHLKITTAPGAKGLYVARGPNYDTPISKNPGENEIILPFGSKFYVKSVKKAHGDATGDWGYTSDTVIELVLLPDLD